jgi:glutathione S-transferase
MILYFKPGACSLADHIALHAAGMDFALIAVDLRTKRTVDGDDYLGINPKGYVPALVLDDGQVLTENAAILSWIADQAPQLLPDGPLGRYRLIEALSYVSGELHKQFKPFFTPGATDEAKAAAREAIAKRLAYLADRIEDGGFLLGPRFGAADAYLFVMLRWARTQGVPVPDALAAYFERVSALPFVQLALTHEAAA